MKNLNLLLAAAALLASTAACATTETSLTDADEPETASTAAEASDEAPRRSARGHSRDAFFDKYDVDGDGKVSQAEFMAERENGYRRRDADGDGSVYSEEYVSEYEVRLIQQLEDQHKRQVDQAEFRFTVLDKDEDGVLSLEEFHNSGGRIFTTLDTNGDGVVDTADTEESY